MQYRRFGKTNLKLSVFSLGTMRYFATKENACETISAAIEKGINHLETARGYGQSEEFLGRAIVAGLSIPPHRYVLGSSVRSFGGGISHYAIQDRLGLWRLDGARVHAGHAKPVELFAREAHRLHLHNACRGIWFPRRRLLAQPLCAHHHFLRAQRALQ